MESEASFELFGTGHLLAMLTLVVMGVALVYPAARWLTRGQARALGVALAVFMFIEELVDRGYHVALGDDFWGHLLPLQMCGASVFLVMFLLVTHSRLVFHLVYFWGLGGASMAILTPDIAYAFPHLLHITYFASHALIVIGVVYMMANYGYRPTLRSLLTVIIFSNVYLLCMFPVNWLLGTNFLFISEKPETGSLLDFMGPWPWYVVGMEVVGILIFCLLYVPYLVADLVRTGSVLEQRASEN